MRGVTSASPSGVSHDWGGGGGERLVIPKNTTMCSVIIDLINNGRSVSKSKREDYCY